MMKIKKNFTNKKFLVLFLMFLIFISTTNLYSQDDKYLNKNLDQINKNLSAQTENKEQKDRSSITSFFIRTVFVLLILAIIYFVIKFRFARSIEEKKQALSGGGMREKFGKPSSQPKEEKKDTTIFGGKSAIPMSEAAWKLRKASPYIPGTGGAMFSEQERMEIAKEISKKYGGYLKKGDELSRIYKDLYKQKGEAKTGAEKLKIDRKIRWLQERLGK